jgi:hypothetical protein
MPAHRKNCLTQLSELTNLCHDPAVRFFTLALRFEVDGQPCTITVTSLTGICSKMHIERRGGRSDRCSRRIGLRGYNDRGCSDRCHDTHNAYL